MEQRITLSSEAARKYNNKNTPSEFLTVFDRPLMLDKNKTYVIGLDSINTMTYSWYNISDRHRNKLIRYYNGTEWKDIIFDDGIYSYTDINNYIKETLIINDDFDDQSSIAPISLEFNLSSFKVLINVLDNFQLDLTTSNFHTLIGFDKKIVTQTEYSNGVPNITNSVDTIYIHCDLISHSLVDGTHGDVIYVFSTANLTRSYPFEREPKRIYFSEVNKTIINSIKIHITDFDGRIIDLNGIDTSFSLVLKEL